MLLKTPALLILLSVFLLSCSKTKTIAFSEVTITTPDNKIVEINIPKAQDNTPVSNLINTTINHKISESLQFNTENTHAGSIEDIINQFNKEYQDFKNQFQDSAQEWEAQIDGEISFQSPEIISMSLTSYTNTGGAHGNLVVSFLNFDTTTGNLIPNHQLFINAAQFSKLAFSYFKDEIKSKTDMEFDAEAFKLPENIGYSSEGIILLYNAYEIASYAFGITEFVIPYSEANPYLKIKGF